MQKKVVYLLLVMVILLASFVYSLNGQSLGCQAWSGNELILVECNYLNENTVCVDSSGNPIYKNGLPKLCTNTELVVIDEPGPEPIYIPETPLPKPANPEPGSNDPYYYMEECLSRAIGTTKDNVDSKINTCLDIHNNKLEYLDYVSTKCEYDCYYDGYSQSYCQDYCSEWINLYGEWLFAIWNEDVISKAINSWKASLNLAECEWTCGIWTPSDVDCQGGYQFRDCSCPCDVSGCDKGDYANYKICSTSKTGFPNVPLKTGSYIYVQPYSWDYTEATHGEYNADFINFYIGVSETDGKNYLITDGGVHIQGIGLHVGEKDSKLSINTLLPHWINGYDDPDIDSIEILGINNISDTTITKIINGFDIEFNVKDNILTQEKNISLNLITNKRLIESIPLIADVQQEKDKLLKGDYSKDDETTSSPPFIIILFFFVIVGIIIKNILKKKYKK